MTDSVESRLVLNMEASLAKFEKQLAKGMQAGTRTAVGLEKKFANSNKRIQQTSDSAAKGIGRLTQMSGRGRFVLQNTANQVGDIAVQMGSGTTAARALGQQLPQLFGGFGVLGGALGTLAPLLGTVAALGIPLAAAFLMTGKESLDLDEKLQGLAKSLDNLRAAESALAQSPSDLMDKYGALASRASELFEIQHKMAALAAKADLDTVTRGIADEMGVAGVLGVDPSDIRLASESLEILQNRINALQNSGARGSDTEMAAALAQIKELTGYRDDLKGLVNGFDKLGDMLGITEAQASEVAARFAEVGQADGARAQAEAMLALAQHIQTVSGNLVGAEDEGRALYDQLVLAVQSAFEFAGIDMSANLNAAAQAARTFTGELQNALVAKRALAVEAATGGNPDFFDPRNESGTAGQVKRERGVPAKNRPGYKPPKAKKGGGGGSKSNPRMDEAKRLFQETRTEAEKYALEVERINALHREFPEIISGEVKDRALDVLEDGFKGISAAADTLEASLENLFVSILSRSASASDALGNLAQQLGNMALKAAFSGLFGGVSDGIASFFSTKKRASGGGARAGSPYMVNEGTPRSEIFVPSANGAVLTVGQAQSALAGMSRGGDAGGLSVNFAPSIDARGADQAAVSRLEASLQDLASSLPAKIHDTLRRARNHRTDKAWR